MPCFLCNKTGHWVADCPKGEGNSIKSGRCFACGSSDHKMKDCPKRTEFR